MPVKTTPGRDFLLLKVNGTRNYHYSQLHLFPSRPLEQGTTVLSLPCHTHTSSSSRSMAPTTSFPSRSSTQGTTVLSLPCHSHTSFSSRSIAPTTSFPSRSSAQGNTAPSLQCHSHTSFPSRSMAQGTTVTPIVMLQPHPFKSPGEIWHMQKFGRTGHMHVHVCCITTITYTVHVRTYCT